jgi:hypothetical protein
VSVCTNILRFLYHLIYRQACGYCRSSEDDVDVANYDYNMAIDPVSCHNPAFGLAFHFVDFKKGNTLVYLLYPVV